MNPIYFQKEPTEFYSELRSEINNYFVVNNISHRANKILFFKISIMFLLYIFAYSSLFLANQTEFSLFITYIFIGSWSVLLGLNIGHDATHNAIFKIKKYNKYLLYIFEILGTNAYNWKNRHLGAHHLFPNIMNQDSDIQQTNFVKIFPKDKHKKWHSLQHIYMPVVYMFYIFRWVFYRDFKDAHSKTIGAFDNSNYPKHELFKMIFFKLLYIFYMIVIPYCFLDFSILTILIAFFILTIAGSLVITMVLLSTHVGEEANFPEPDKNGMMPHSWSYHQIITAADFGTNSWILNHAFGGFNHHVIHHLFRHICHVHYPALTPILRELCHKYGLPYRHKKYLFAAMYSHFILLYKNSKQKISQLNLTL